MTEQPCNASRTKTHIAKTLMRQSLLMNWGQSNINLQDWLAKIQPKKAADPKINGFLN
jgi:hypothetical protein